MDEDQRPVERETTVINTGGGGGGGGAIAAVLVVLVLGVLAFLYFNGTFGGADKTDININVGVPKVEIPKVELPDIRIETPPANQATNQSGK
jgi:hypothetical protein